MKRGQGHTKGKDSPHDKRGWETWAPHTTCHLLHTPNWLKTQFSTSSLTGSSEDGTPPSPPQAVSGTQKATPHFSSLLLPFSSPFPPGVTCVLRKRSSCQCGCSPTLSGRLSPVWSWRTRLPSVWTQPSVVLKPKPQWILRRLNSCLQRHWPGHPCRSPGGAWGDGTHFSCLRSQVQRWNAHAHWVREAGSAPCGQWGHCRPCPPHSSLDAGLPDGRTVESVQLWAVALR